MTQRTRSANLGGTVITSTGVVLASGLDVSNQSNAAYQQANTARNTANSAFNHANNAFDHANSAFAHANTIFDRANAAYLQANTARSDANTTFATVNSTFGTINTAITNAHNQANSARSDANTTFATVNSTFGTVNTAITNAHNQANSAFAAANLRLSTSGGSISGDLAITGNLTVTGNATTINVSNLSVNDSMILLSTNAVGDSNDIGFIGHFDRGATATHAGLIRKATQNQFYLFDNYEVEPSNNVIDVAGNNFRVGNLRLGIINANSFVTSAGLNVTDQANSAFAAANNRVLKAGDTMTGQLNISSGGLLVTGTAQATYFYGLAAGTNDSANFGNSQSNLRIGGNGSHVTLNAAPWGFNLVAGSGSGNTALYVNTSGSVGVGTSSPGAKLDVSAGNVVLSGSSTADQFIRIGSGRTGNGFSYLDLQGDSTYSNGLRLIRLNAGPNSGSSIESRGTGALQFVTQEAAPIDFYTNGANLRLKIDSSGNVGVGTATPSSYGRFAVVAGNTYFYVASSGFWSSVFGPRSAGDGFCSVGMYYNNSGGYWKMDSASGAFTFYENGTLRASISNAGQLQSYATTGTAPLVIASTTAVANLNADLLDGYQASSFVQRTNASDQTTLWDPYGQYYTAVWGVGNDFNNFVNSGSYHVDHVASNHASAGSYGYLRIWRHIGSNYLLQEFTPSGSAVSTWRRLGQDNGAGSRIWTSWAKYWSDGNDGSGSGLDADLLDGLQGSSFLRSDASATNSVDLRAPIFYDSNDTNYYVNPNGGSLFWTMTPYVLSFAGVGGNSTIGNQSYAIYQEGGAWTHPYPDLAIAYHTGIKIGAYFGYNGTRFYNNNDMGTQIASVGDGDNNFRSYYNVIAYASDGRLKENIQPIENAIEKVKKITGMTFDWKPMVTDLGFEPNSIHETGVIAQDVEAVLPEAVEIAPFDYDWKQPNKSKSGEKYLTVKYEKLVPLLIQAIKEQQEQIEELKNLIKEKLS